MLVENIIGRHASGGRPSVGEISVVAVDRIYIQDGNSPTLARLFRQHGFSKVFDPRRIAVFFDHSVLWPNSDMANRIREAMAFCASLGLQVYRGGEGISHVVAMEEGWFEPGSIVLGTDSHTCAGGASQSLALGMGASDVCAAMVTGETWLRTPPTVRLRTRGHPNRHCSAKDVVLHALRTFGQEPFLYRAIEWDGAWVRSLGRDEAETLTSMGVDMGAKCVFLPPHAGRPDLPEYPQDPCEHVLDLDLDGLTPVVALPHDPSNVVSINVCAGQRVDYVFIGSCTNSRLDDIAQAAALLRGRKVDAGVHCVVTPGSRSIYKRAAALGYIDELMSAGAVISPPGCGACLGTQGSVPADGDRVLSTMNRNFLGRMGNARAEIYLSSPLVAAHAALTGVIPALCDLEAAS